MVIHKEANVVLSLENIKLEKEHKAKEKLLKMFVTRDKNRVSVIAELRAELTSAKGILNKIPKKKIRRKK